MVKGRCWGAPGGTFHPAWAPETDRFLEGATFQKFQVMEQGCE